MTRILGTCGGVLSVQQQQQRSAEVAADKQLADR